MLIHGEFSNGLDLTIEFTNCLEIAASHMALDLVNKTLPRPRRMRCNILLRDAFNLLTHIAKNFTPTLGLPKIAN